MSSGGLVGSSWRRKACPGHRKARVAIGDRLPYDSGDLEEPGCTALKATLRTIVFMEKVKSSP